jgi:putative membrane protein
MLLVRIFVNALALIVITLLPDIHFVEPTVLRILFVALILGVLNAFVKPIIQFLTLRFIFITYGFAVVIINTIILLLLNIIVSGMFAVESLLWAIIGGALMGLIAGFFENLLGLQIPILPEDFASQTTLATDPTMSFQTKIVSQVLGPDEHLAAEIPLANEVTEPAVDSDTPQQREER